MALHGVTVWFSNENVFIKVPQVMGHHYRLTEDVKEWLKDNTYGKGWCDREIREVTTGDYIGVEFMFTESSQAMMFKLAWGGGKL